MSNSPDLASLLHRTFGFAEFRANQEAVCAAAVEGRDVLLVMPTGAGKSLCYQLPAIARGGTALVISPLIALIEDQSSKLAALGLNVGRIHSGMDREEARQVCRDYLDGKLQFLFIAPERMRVPGFAAMLAKRKLSLIAIDEAHCISQWGHDFRPDYRTLGQHLHALRPTPVMALTATATTEVQRDIVVQLGLGDAARFIHGFRRTNLAVEAVEVPRPQRAERVRALLQDASRRPAIVYAPSRKDAESIAAELHNDFPSAAYHAGLDAGTRDRVQRGFLEGRVEVVVATVAFGMGIDKADVRTVLHTAAPASMEAFYQEIGRAGRDGLPSRSVLMYSFLDRKTHEFLLERSYPPIESLKKIERGLARGNEIHADDLRIKLKMSMEDFAPAMDRLVALGVASLDFSGNTLLATEDQSWAKNYEQQVNLRRTQTDRMMNFAAGQVCRMAALIRHFGDAGDGSRTCGLCDVCAPGDAIAQDVHEPDVEEERALARVLRAVPERGLSTGKLMEAAKETDRRLFDTYLDALTRAGYLAVEESEFRNGEGETIRFRKVTQTYEGRNWNGEPLENVVLRSAPDGKSKKSRSSEKKSGKTDATPLTAAEKPVAEKLRQWRAGVAKALGQPAFCVFSDRVLEEIVRSQPLTTDDLLQVKGMGEAKVAKWGAEICAALGSTAPIPPLSSAIAKPATVVKRQESPAAVAATASTLDRIAASERTLRIWRMNRARVEGLAPFLLLTEEAVRGIAHTRPADLDALAAIEGVGDTRARKYGGEILGALASCVA